YLGLFNLRKKTNAIILVIKLLIYYNKYLSGLLQYLPLGQNPGCVSSQKIRQKVTFRLLALKSPNSYKCLSKNCSVYAHMSQKTIYLWKAKNACRGNYYGCINKQNNEK